MAQATGIMIISITAHRKAVRTQILVNYAATSPDGMATLPLYMFYHPQSALQGAARALPAIEGINIRLARDVVGTVAGGCKRKEKKVSRWRAGFMSLSDLLCWPVVNLPAPPSPTADPATEFLLPGGIPGAQLSVNRLPSGPSRRAHQSDPRRGSPRRRRGFPGPSVAGTSRQHPQGDRWRGDREGPRHSATAESHPQHTADA